MFDPTIACANPHCRNRFEKRDVRQRYCSKKCQEKELPPFIAVDGEGIGHGRDHHYVLLGVHDVQREWPNGVSRFTDVCAFLYEMFETNPEAIYVGFYLTYDFNMWLRMLPRERASMLLSAAGIAARKRHSPHAAPFPVEYQDWQFDLLPGKRFKLRAKGDKSWMNICDAGPFFQSSLLTALNPAKWSHPVISDSEYARLAKGKQRRPSAELDADLRKYNVTENMALEIMMDHYRRGLARAGVDLRKQQWFGPGQAAQAWLRGEGERVARPVEAIRKRARADLEWRDAVIATYYGGWFSIAAHGIVEGTTHEYDINSAYPAIAASLPCVCGGWKRGTGRPPKGGHLTFARVTAVGRSRYLGGLPYRTGDNHVLRPRHVTGWYWENEIKAAKRAGLVDDVVWHEWWTYNGCSHEKPFRHLAGLYKQRLEIGKDTPEGKAFKLIYNSVYGKLCQSAGEDTPFSNPVYASLITSGCRTMILDAIATHPEGAAAVVMVATDAVFFTTPHPGLPISSELGDWDTLEHENLCLFKPGVYWDDKSRELIAEGKDPKFKSRGVNARDFADSIAAIDAQFKAWGTEWLPGMGPGKGDWPTVEFTSRFAQTSVKQALAWTDKVTPAGKQVAMYKNMAGVVKEGQKLRQDSYPGVKRNPEGMWHDGRAWRSEPWAGGAHWPDSKPYDKDFGLSVSDWEGYHSPDAPVMLEFRAVLKSLPYRYLIVILAAYRLWVSTANHSRMGSDYGEYGWIRADHGDIPPQRTMLRNAHIPSTVRSNPR